MEKLKVIEIQKRVYENNDEQAQKLRQKLKNNNTFLINLMSSPGSGKTTFLVNMINRMKDNISIGVVEADIDSDVDAYTIKDKTDVAVNQLHSGGMCHIDAGMAEEGLEDLNYKELDLAIIENIGNLICPASYDLGQTLNVMILSVPEGDDKPLKYPKMFSKVDVLIVSKIDTLSVFDFDFNALEERAKALNDDIEIFSVSAKNGKNMAHWCNYLADQIKTYQKDG